MYSTNPTDKYSKINAFLLLICLIWSKDKNTAFVGWRRNEHPLEKDITKVVYNCPEIKRDGFFLIIYKVLFYICFSWSLKTNIFIFIYCCFLFIVFIRSKNELFFFLHPWWEKNTYMYHLQKRLTTCIKNMTYESLYFMYTSAFGIN